MESKDLLHPEFDENQNIEVNAGASTEAQSNAEIEPSQVVETLPEAETHSEIAQPTPEIQENPTPNEAIAATAETSTIVETPTEVENTADVVTPKPEVTENEAVITVPVEEKKTKNDQKSTAVSDMMNEIENATQLASQNEENGEEDDEDDEDDDKSEESIEEIEKEYFDYSLEQLVNSLNTVVANPDIQKIKHRVGILKANILEKIKQEKKAQYEAYKQENENAEEYVQEPLAVEELFNSALAVYKTNKQKFIDNLEAAKQANLEAKRAIIDGLKQLIENESNLKILNDNFKELQDKWKEIGPVPQNESTNLWQNYHFYVEKFFDILRINKELRSLDLKKNLEQKIKLCESAESLLLQDSINKSFKELQKLHEEWKEIGPVPEDKKEEIWERFKIASDQINQRRRDHYNDIIAEQQNNYNAKVVLCEQAEELITKETTSVKESNEIAEKLTELMKVWKTLGPAPIKVNDEIWTRFKSSLDKFFQAKKDYFQQIKEEQLQNYNMKLNLAIRAEALAKRTDWKAATEEIIALQKEWKTIGAVSKKYSEAVWKRFRTACDQFFEAKSYYFTNIKAIEKENLEKKENLIERILNHVFTNDKEENLEAMKAYQREWTEYGHVPKNDKDRIYNSYREALNKRFADLKMSVEDIRHDKFKNKIDTILNNPDADKMLDKEKRFLINKLAQLKEDISLWENNLGFFSNSKNADLLKAEFSKKIDAAKAEVTDLEYKIKMMNRPK